MFRRNEILTSVAMLAFIAVFTLLPDAHAQISGVESKISTFNTWLVRICRALGVTAVIITALGLWFSRNKDESKAKFGYIFVGGVIIGAAGEIVKFLM